ncbi:hypothetical protein CDN99_05090 [Roseateles aquatilis]|uniref:HEPN domain-containing protein n=1 Tax=Roseateles aquatilis TaxID=431061 RepID=A0A246JMT1_9BURK|nr:hypothetical protein [Roseateles aquatilis]OWQ93813.1 hypothetical protein CDN99_05090 [Roseateles aquatilis]
MAITHRDLLRLAVRQAMTPTEPWRRSAISRAYYAAFHRCLLWEKALPHKSRVKTSGGAHKQLIDRLLAPHPACGPLVAKRSKDLGELLAVQRDRRVDADYRLKKQISATDLARQMAQAAAVLKACER